MGGTAHRNLTPPRPLALFFLVVVVRPHKDSSILVLSLASRMRSDALRCVLSNFSNLPSRAAHNLREGIVLCF